MLQCSHPEDIVEIGDEIEELEGGVFEEECDGGEEVPREEFGRYEFYSAESGRDKVFVDFSFLEVAHPYPPRIKIVTLSLVLLDSESRVCKFNNAKLVENIHPHKEEKCVRIHTNGGTQLFSGVADYTRLNMIV